MKMPSRSPEQARLMRAVAHGWKKPGGGGPTRAVAEEFVNADRRGKVQGYNFGGITGPGMYRGALSRFAPTGPSPLQVQGSPPKRMPGGVTSPQLPPRGAAPKRMPGGVTTQQLPPSGRRLPPLGDGRGEGIGGLSQGDPSRFGRGPQGRVHPGGMQPWRGAPRGGYPGGGNPMTGGRNPMMRQVNDRVRPGSPSRGATSYFR